jgi:hypothetical protein
MRRMARRGALIEPTSSLAGLYRLELVLQFLLGSATLCERSSIPFAPATGSVTSSQKVLGLAESQQARGCVGDDVMVNYCHSL